MGRVSPGTMTVVLMATLFGLGGAFVVRQQMARQTPPPLQMPTAQPNRVYVPLAVRDLPVGTKVVLTDMAVLQFSPEEFAKSKYAGQGFIGNNQQIFNRVLRTPIAKGEFFPADAFYPEGYGPGVAERLKPGYRAVTVPIEDIGAVAGFAEPGANVDVLFRSSEAAKRPEITLTLLEHVEVLALDTNVIPGQRIELKREGKVTLSVTPAQAKILKVVEGKGTLSLSLRHPEDDAVDNFPVRLGQNDGRGPAALGATTVGFHGDLGLIDRGGDLRLIERRGGLDRIDHLDADTLKRVINDASQQLTLDDLLGIPAAPEKRTMEVYKAGSREVLEFDQKEEQSQDILQRGARVRTPVAGI